MPALDEFVREELEKIHNRAGYRALSTSYRQENNRVARDEQELISFACNDYLGLSHHPHVKEAAQQAILYYGAGAGASRMVTGNHPLYSELEKKLAAYKGTESACVMGSGYLANIGVIPALMGEKDLIIADKLIHACLLDGIRLSGATLLRFPHNNSAACEKLLHKHRANYRNCLIVTETIFSMDGDLAPIAELSQLAKNHKCWLLVDDAHGIGEVETGKIDIIVGTLSKAFGSYGGYICGSNLLIDYLRNSARSFIFSTALPPMVIASALAALDIMKEDTNLAAKALANAKLFTSLLGIEAAQSTIVPLIIGEAEKTLAASQKLEQEGFFVAAIRPPTVPPNTSRLRFTFSSQHKQKDIERLAEAIKQGGW